MTTAARPMAHRPGSAGEGTSSAALPGEQTPAGRPSLLSGWLRAPGLGVAPAMAGGDVLAIAWRALLANRRRSLAAAAVLVVAAIPFLTGGGVAGAATPASSVDVLGLVGKVIAVAGLLFLTLVGLRRVQGKTSSRDQRLTVLETRSLGPKASLHLVAVGERRLVIGLTPGGMVGLAELHASELDAATADTMGLLGPLS